MFSDREFKWTCSRHLVKVEVQIPDYWPIGALAVLRTSGHRAVDIPDACCRGQGAFQRPVKLPGFCCSFK